MVTRFGLITRDERWLTGGIWVVEVGIPVLNGSVMSEIVING